MGATTQNWIGRSQYASDPYLNGRVDDFRIYNNALSASQVMHLLNGQTVLPVAELPFNETTGTTASDVTGNGWNGTLTGGASLAAGNKGNAVDLSGTSQYVALPAGVVSSAKRNYCSSLGESGHHEQLGADLRLRFRILPHYMYLTPKNGANGFIRFRIKKRWRRASLSTGPRRCLQAAGIM